MDRSICGETMRASIQFGNPRTEARWSAVLFADRGEDHVELMNVLMSLVDKRWGAMKLRWSINCSISMIIMCRPRPAA